MRRSMILAMAVVAIAGLVVPTAAASRNRSGTVEFADARMIVEVNATDGDAGFQIFLDADGWRSVRITAPDGRKMLDVKPTGRLTDFGLTELFSESSEPPFTEAPLAEFRKRFPEGEYKFTGTTIDGKKMKGSATFTHNIPDGPTLVAPVENATVDPTQDLTIEWEPVTTPDGIEIVRYQILVEQEEPLRSFSIEVLADVTSITVPAAFFEPRQAYKFEVLAIEEGGNQTLTEREFDTSS